MDIKIGKRHETRKTAELTPYSRNSRTHSVEQVSQIAASIKEWGFTAPILIDELGVVLAGHGRLLAAQKIGMLEVPVIVADGWTEVQKRAYVIADNKLALNAGWDTGLLSSEFEAIKFDGFDLNLTGFDAEEINKFLAVPVEGLTDEDDAPEPDEVPISAPGDVWMLGAHRVMCGSATVQIDVERLMGGAKADMLLTDPPYNVAYEGKTKDALKIKNDSMGDSEFRQFLRDAFSIADSVMRPGAVFYIWHADKEGYNFRGACQDVGWKVRQCLIWVKNQIVMGRQDYHWRHEPCLYGWKDGAPHYWASDRKQQTTIDCKKPQRNGEHPTMKPVELVEYQLGNNTRAGNIVLDLFGGSGSTLIACQKTQRSCRMMELDQKYVDVIVKRWQAFTGKEATHADTEKTFKETAYERSRTAAA